MNDEPLTLAPNAQLQTGPSGIAPEAASGESHPPRPDSPRGSEGYSGLLTVAILAVTILALYFARDVLLPLALAILLGFVLAPGVARLERWGAGRVPSVVIVLALAFSLLAGVGWIVARQFAEVTAKLPEYRDTLLDRARALGGAARGTLTEFTETLSQIGAELTKGPRPERAAEAPAESSEPPLSADESAAVPVKVLPAPTSPLDIARSWFSPLLGPLGTSGLVVVLVTFILIERRDLRTRMIQLIGSSHLHVTTEAINDAANRVSRYLRAQLLINASYGAAVTLGLALLGMPNAVLWGVLGALLRFLPYVGPALAAAMPIGLSLAVFEGWSRPLLVAGLFIALELVVNNGLEPWLYGASIGVSSFGIIMMAVFWTWLWGPIGLVLAMPLTVCLVVAGNYVPSLRFLTILLSDRPTMPLQERIYQRLLALDEEEASELAAEYLQTKKLEDLYDEALLPALFLAERDRHNQVLTEDQEHRILRAVQRLADELRGRTVDSLENGVRPASPLTAHLANRPRVLCIPARDAADEIAGSMLAEVLRRRGYEAEVGSIDVLASEWLQQVSDSAHDAVVISTLPPLGARDGRYLCKRLRAELPELPIVFGLWFSAEREKTRERLLASGATEVVGSLSEAAETVEKLVIERATQRMPRVA